MTKTDEQMERLKARVERDMYRSWWTGKGHSIPGFGCRYCIREKFMDWLDSCELRESLDTVETCGLHYDTVNILKDAYADMYHEGWCGNIDDEEVKQHIDGYADTLVKRLEAYRK